MTLGYLGLGSNLGDRLENLRDAVRRLTEGGAAVRRSSRVYETEPVGGPPQPDFLNAVVQVAWEADARGLLDRCLEIERAMGRVRDERWGPRLIDLDVLTFGTEVIDEPGLKVPHPRMHERGFVLVPLLELDADPPLADGRRAAELRLGPDVIGGVRPVAPPLTG